MTPAPDLTPDPNAPQEGPPPLLRLVWRHRLLVLLGVAVGLLLGGLYFAQAPPLYQASAQVLVVKKGPAVLPTPSGTAALAYVEDYVSTHLTLIRSRAVLEAAVRRGQLTGLPTFADAGDPAGALQAGLTVTRDTKDPGARNNILIFTFRGPHAEDAGRAVQAVIASYNEFLEGLYGKVKDDTVALVTQARELLQKDLAAKEEAYSQFRRTAPLLWKGKEGVNEHLEALAAVQTARAKLVVRLAEVQSRLAAVERGLKAGQPRDALYRLALRLEGRAEAAPAAPPSGPLSELETQLLALQAQEQTALEDYGPDHPQIKALRKRIALVRELARSVGPRPAAAPKPEGDPLDLYLQGLRQEAEDLKLTDQTLLQASERHREEARKFSDFELQDDRLRGAIVNTQQLYNGIVKQLQEARLDKDLGGGFEVQTISPAGPGGKVEPNPLRILPAGALFGLLLGLGLAVLASWSDQAFQGPEDVRRRLGLPVIGQVPLFPAPPTAGPLAPTLVAYHRPRSPDAEAFRVIRTALYFSTRGVPHRVIQITSPAAGDGKSTLAANLAIAIAQAGKRVLLIDADFRRPRLAALFGLPAAPAGLAAVLAHQAELPDVLSDTAVPGLAVLPCGPVPPNPAELLTGEGLVAVLEQVRARFDYVVVDTPPLLAVTDPAVVAPRVDGVLLAVRPSRDARGKAERARDILHGLQVPVLGVVVNGVTAGGGGYRGYRYGYDLRQDPDAQGHTPLTTSSTP